ncbi:DoxX family protein [Corallococcus terminator]
MTTATPLASEPVPVAPVPAAPITAAPEPAPWRLATRVAFRFVFAYVFLFNFAFPLDTLPVIGEHVSKAISDFWELVVPWVFRHVVGGQELSTAMSGSGDKAFDYAQTGLFVALAVIAAAVWSVVDRHRTRYAKAHDVLRVYVRYTLAMTMLSYGLSKVFKSQFPFPSMDKLTQPVGELSPMGLLWAFMGYSPGYNLFTGGAEVLGGLLLVFRRTTTLGALVVIGVMSNVVALNFFYDVPVKLYSTQLLLFAVFLLAPDLRRLADVLVLNRATQPVALATPFTFSSRTTWALLGVKLLFIGWMLHSHSSRTREAYSTWGEGAPRPPLYGLYEVESFTREGAVLPPLLGDTTRWRGFSISRGSWMTLRRMDGSKQYFQLTGSVEDRTLTLAEGRGEDAKKTTLTLEQPDPEHLVLQGTFEGAAIDVRVRKADTSRFHLLSRGFHWVQEAPFNR